MDIRVTNLAQLTEKSTPFNHNAYMFATNLHITELIPRFAALLKLIFECSLLNKEPCVTANILLLRN